LKLFGFQLRLTGKRRKYLADDLHPERKTSWLRRLCAGDECAFGEFVRKYQQAVFLFCRSLGLTENDAEDVAAETFLAAHKSLPGYAGRAKLSTWLLRVAYNKTVNHLRKNKRYQQLTVDFGELLVDNGQEPSANVEKRELSETVWSAVQRLPKQPAAAIVLFYREGKTVSEIAKIMKKRKNTVKTYLFRGRNMLKGLLADSAREDNYVGR
jgi:RNA polymerase sigma-70 factor, ECF subfamily